MTTRFTVKPRSRYGVSPLPSGYDASKSAGDVTVPSCGIEDVDRAVFSLFEKEIPLVVRVNNDETKRVPVIFAASEKWAMLNKSNAIQDKNGSLILPLVTIVRTDVVQTMQNDIAGRGANQHTGELTIKRRLSPRDRGYQNLINKQTLRNQKNVALNPTDALVTDQISTLRNVGELTLEPTIAEGGALIADRRNNIVEVYTIPTPQKVTIKYVITLWSQHQQQANGLIEACLSSYLPQTRGWRVETTKGYWFNALVTSDEYSSKGNPTDTSREERIIKHEISVEVPCFILVSSAPGLPIPVKRYVSAPRIEFTLATGSASETISPDVEVEPFLGSDDPTLPLSPEGNKRRDARQTGHGKVYPAQNTINESDPALASLPRGKSLARWHHYRTIDAAGTERSRYVRVRSTGPGGETVVSGELDLGGVTIVSVDE